MNRASESGHLLVEALAAVLLAGLTLAALASVIAPRLETAQHGSEQAELQRIADLAAEAAAHGWLAPSATRPRQLRAVWAGAAVPEKVGGKSWSMRLDDQDPRILWDEQVIRPRTYVRDARMTLWQARALRAEQDHAD